MSSENVAVVRRANEAFTAGDVETALNLLDPDIEWHGTVGGMDEDRVYRGRDEVVQGFIEYFENWERMELPPMDRAEALRAAGLPAHERR